MSLMIWRRRVGDNLPATVEGNRGLPAVGMAELLVGPPLSNLFESQFVQN
jgi:hypothetical protein